jgi:HD-GYP domain-containing protein (c-di-GMP phosphodiesterase class II)
MPFRTRVFLLCFVPFAVLLTGSFWTIQQLVQKTARNGLVASLRENQLAMARMRSRSDLQNSRYLRVAGENASLKAGLQILLENPDSPYARETVVDQLRELCGQMGFDFLLASDPDGKPLAGVVRTDSGLQPLAALPESGVFYRIASVPIDQGQDNIGQLSVGERFDLGEFNTPAVVLQNGHVLGANLAGIAPAEVENALRSCGSGECDVRLGGHNFISLPLESGSFGGGYAIRILENVDTASGPIRTVLNRVFVGAAAAALLAALLFSGISAQNIVEPIAAMISHLQKSENTGLLPEFSGDFSSIREIQELMSSFNRAAGSIREGRQNLQNAYVEFVGALANALDARDCYTAGHSGRVSALSCATAEAMGVRGEELNDLRIAALLHDIGKIGIADSVLQKPGRLTQEEFAVIKQHPEIGRRILEGVHGFAAYLPAVELHHENWDGTGYPRGESGETTPLAARIIHVSDAYDAMTTDRPYRAGMRHQEAISVLQRFAGRQFDPRVVEAFVVISSGFGAATDERLPEPQYAGVGAA